MDELTQAWHPGARVARVRKSHSYGLVLLFIVTSFVFASVAPQSVWADSVLVLLQSGTLVLALWTSGVARPNSPISLTLLVSTAIAALVFFISGGDTFRGLVGLLSGLVVVATLATIALGVIDQRKANLQAVTGAICVYILLGMVFFFLYGSIAALGTQPFFASGTDGTRPIRLYFSFVTLATVGYGDYTAGGNLGRMLAVVEALLGQLYLVTVIAVLVSRISGRGSAADAADA
jgi:ion channel